MSDCGNPSGISQKKGATAPFLKKDQDSRPVSVTKLFSIVITV